MPQEIKLDRTRILRYGIGAVQEIEQRLGGRSIYELVAGASVTFISVALHEGLKADDPKIDQATVNELLEEYIKSSETASLKDAMGWIVKGLEESGLFKMGKSTRKKEGGQPPTT